MKKILSIISLMFITISSFAGDLVAIGKHMTPKEVNTVCATVYIGGNNDPKEVMESIFAWCSFRVQDTCIFLYRDNDIKGKQAAVQACSKLDGTTISEEGAEKLAATLNQMNIPINEEQARASRGEIVKFQGM